MFVQLTADGFIAASYYLLTIGLSFGLIYRAARFFNLAHGALLTLTPYVLFLLHSRSCGSERAGHLIIRVCSWTKPC